ncbi:MAG TPA: acyl carrier protein [Azospirillum sp.]|nr:acyl carrier protein [Azospirillum sp.]
MSQIAFSRIPGGALTPVADSTLDIAQEVRTIIAESGLLSTDVSTLTDDDDLFVAGLTSHGTVNLMFGLEERFDVEFPDTMLRRRTFENVAAICTAVSELLNMRSDAAAGNASA